MRSKTLLRFLQYPLSLVYCAQGTQIPNLKLCLSGIRELVSAIPQVENSDHHFFRRSREKCLPSGVVRQDGPVSLLQVGEVGVGEIISLGVELAWTVGVVHWENIGLVDVVDKVVDDVGRAETQSLGQVESDNVHSSIWITNVASLLSVVILALGGGQAQCARLQERHQVGVALEGGLVDIRGCRALDLRHWILAVLRLKYKGKIFLGNSQTSGSRGLEGQGH